MTTQVRAQIVERLLRAATIQVLGAVLAGVIGLANTYLVVRILGKDLFGRFVAVQATLMLLSAVAGYGLSMAATRFASELRVSPSKELANQLDSIVRSAGLIGTVLAGVLAAAAIPTARHALKAPELSSLLMAASAGIVFLTLDSIEKSILVGLEASRHLAIAQMISAGLNSACVIGGAIAFGVQGAALGFAVGTALQFLTSHRAVRTVLRLRCINRSISKAALDWEWCKSFALPGALASLALVAANWMAQVILVRTPNGFSELAVLNIAMQWFNIVLFLPTAAGRAVTPLLVERTLVADGRGAAALLGYGMLANGTIALVAGGIVAFLSPRLMTAYGPAFEPYHVCLIYAAATAFVGALQMPTTLLFTSGSKMRLCALLNIGWALVYAGGAWLLADLGASGICLAFLIAYLYHCIPLSIFAWSECRKAGTGATCGPDKHVHERHA